MKKWYTRKSRGFLYRVKVKEFYPPNENIKGNSRIYFN
jgi:hypothetical protein